MNSPYIEATLSPERLAFIVPLWNVCLGTTESCAIPGREFSLPRASAVIHYAVTCWRNPILHNRKGVGWGWGEILGADWPCFLSAEMPGQPAGSRHRRKGKATVPPYGGSGLRGAGSPGQGVQEAGLHLFSLFVAWGKISSFLYPKDQSTSV